MNNLSKPIRVAMVIQEYYPIIGGAERQLESQILLLKDLGLEIHVVTRRWPGLSSFEMIGGIPVHRMLSWGPRPIAALTFIVSALWKLLWLKPDVIHAFELLSPSTVAVLAKHLLHRPLIIKILRGGSLGDITKIGRGLLGKLRLALITNAADAFVVISHEIDAELKMLGIPVEKRVFITNGVDTKRFSPVSSSEKKLLRNRLGLPDGLTAVFSGRLESEKCLNQLIEIWPSLRSKYFNANLLLVGTGSQESHLRSMAGEGIAFTGGVEAVEPYLQAADIFVLPSISEGLSNSLLEGLSCGLAVMATSIGGTTDVVTHEMNGLLVPPDSPKHLLAGLIRIFDDSEMRHRLGVAGRQLILEKYSLEGVVWNIRQLYDRMIKL